MFDDPQKELKRLEEELLKSSAEDEEFERFYQDIFDEFGPTEDERTPVAPVKKRRSTYADAPRAVAPKKKKSIKGLVITICLELAGIAAVALWWLLRIL
jgi:hypothetical protein